MDVADERGDSVVEEKTPSVLVNILGRHK